MSVRATKWVLWVLLYCIAPVPYTLGANETAPPLRLFLISTLTGLLQVTEGAGGWVWRTFILLGVGQCLLYALGLYFVAAFICRATTRLEDSSRRSLTLAIVAVSLAVACIVPIYETPLSSRSLYSTLLQILY